MPIIICMILYLIGLFGDSYYGITSSFEITKNIYDVIFKTFEYTRNGLFYVPIYIYMGYMLKEKQLNIKTKCDFNCIFNNIEDNRRFNFKTI